MDKNEFELIMTKCYVLWNRISVGESKEKQKEMLESIIKELNEVYERRARKIAETSILNVKS
jgi:hypothetical protein